MNHPRLKVMTSVNRSQFGDTQLEHTSTQTETLVTIAGRDPDPSTLTLDPAARLLGPERDGTPDQPA